MPAFDTQNPFSIVLKPFFTIAMTAPARQATFRRVVMAHVLFVTVIVFAIRSAVEERTLEMAGNLLLVLGLVEGAALIGWRLTQIPKSQALEFLLTSPVQPRRVFIAEAFVGMARFALVWLAGLPFLLALPVLGRVEWSDLLILAVMPFVYGVGAGMGLTAWVYEPVSVRRIGEILGLIGVLIYLIVGVLAGEHLLLWILELPSWLRASVYHSILFVTNMNPFGIVRYWFQRSDPNFVTWIAWERVEICFAFGMLLILGSFLRAMFRLKGHFHDRHYRPIDSKRQNQSALIGERPLSWWAVRRVMEYSGRVNLWLAVGFSLIYAAFLIAGDQWPSWMGKSVFMLFEKWGGAAGVACALSVLAAVPAVFQFGLWDPTIQDRCRRLELLLLTELEPEDYWHASISAAWKRGRGYFLGAGVLWLALGVSGRNSWDEVLAAATGAVVLWSFSFAVGFRSFCTGAYGSGIASLLTLGMPIVMIALMRFQFTDAAAFVPTGVCYVPLTESGGISASWTISMIMLSITTILFSRRGLSRCDADLRTWLDANQGRITTS